MSGVSFFDLVYDGSKDLIALVLLQFYGHRKKMRDLGREHDVENLNRAAIRIAKDVADRHGCLVAGNICNTGMFLPNDYTEMRAMFEVILEYIEFISSACG